MIEHNSFKKEIYPFPSYFGSHSSMIDKEKISKDSNLVILKDEFGNYTTEKCRLDNGLADINRYRCSRLSKLFNKKEEGN